MSVSKKSNILSSDNQTMKLAVSHKDVSFLGSSVFLQLQKGRWEKLYQLTLPSLGDEGTG